MVTSLTDQSQAIVTNQIAAYQYDQLNRIKQVRAHQNFNSSTNQFSGATADAGLYAEDFSYDRNGNILSVQRNGDHLVGTGTQAMDDFTYYYYDNTPLTPGITNDPYPVDGLPTNATNRLAYVKDNVADGNYTTDIDDQETPTYFYEYDGNGNLVKDPSEQIDNIEWYANGKIKSITRENTSTKSDLEFVYDASGNRIIKITKPRDGTDVLSQLHWTYTYYVRDASGNVMGVYERTFENVTGDDYLDNFKNTELHIYGSKRVGTNNVDSLTTMSFTSTGFADGYAEEFMFGYDIPIGGSSPCTDHCKTNYRRELGNKQYEVTNHLGNVLATVSDRKLSVDNYSYTPSGSGNYKYDAQRNIYYAVAAGTGTHNRVGASSDNRADYYTADVISYSDYYAFGAPLPGRNASSSDYRYDFNGKEKDSETELNDFGARIYNARLGRFLSVDPIAAGYPSWSPYQFANNTPIQAIDVAGLASYTVTPCYVCTETKAALETPPPPAFKPSDGAYNGGVGLNASAGIIVDIAGPYVSAASASSVNQSANCTWSSPSSTSKVPDSKNLTVYKTVTACPTCPLTFGTGRGSGIFTLSLSASAGYMVGLGAQYRHWTFQSPHYLYDNSSFGTFSFGPVLGQFGGGGMLSAGFGVMRGMGPWDRPSDIIAQAVVFNLGVQIGPFGLGAESSFGGKGYTLLEVGVGLGGSFRADPSRGAKPMMIEKNPFTTSPPGGGMWFLYREDLRSFEDSLDVAKYWKDDSISQGVLRRDSARRSPWH